MDVNGDGEFELPPSVTFDPRASIEHRVEVMSSMVDILMSALLVQFGDPQTLWQMMGPEAQDTVSEWAAIRTHDMTGAWPNG